MRTIYKFPLKLTGIQTVAMPAGAVALSAQMQHGCLQLWAAVNDDSPFNDFRVYIARTGENASHVAFDMPHGSRHVSTVQDGDFVWHVFIDKFGK